MCYLTSKEDSEYIHKELKKYKKTSDACEFSKKFENKNEIHQFYKGTTRLNQIQSLKNNEHR